MSIYDDRFYKSQFSKSYQSAQRMIAILSEFYIPNSVIDFGCGRGAWLNAFAESGATGLVGYDGAWNADRLASQDKFKFSAHNLELPIAKPEKKFDLAISVEVAEHLPEASANIFVENLIGHSDVILFGASVRHQGGTRHVNEQPQSFWGERFRSRDFVIFDLFRPRMWSCDQIDFWYRQNTFLYVRQGSDLQRQLDEKQIERIENLDWMDVIHPELLEVWVKRANKPLEHLLSRVYRRVRGAL